MFRLKLTLTHAILVCIVLGGAHLFASSDMKPSVERSAELSLRRAAFIAEQTERLDHFSLEAKGEMVARDTDTYEYLTLEREKLLEKIDNAGVNLVGKKVRKKLGGTKDGGGEGDESGGADLGTVDLRHLAVHFRLLVAKNRFQRISDRAEGQKRNIDRSMLERKPVRPDLVAVVNSSGKAVAALGQDRYAWGSSSISPNIASKYSGVQEVLDSGKSKLEVWPWKWRSGDDPAHYQVAIVPVKSNSEDEPAGAAIVGYKIHDGSAENIRTLVGGVTSEKGKRAGDIGETDLPDVAFFHGKDIQSSTFDPNMQKTLGEQFFQKQNILESDDPEQVVRFNLDEKEYIAFVRFLPEEFGSEKPTGVVVMANMAQARAPLQAMLWKLDVLAFLAILLGIGLFLFFYYRFIKPVSEIEETIAEILSGNKDAEFVLSSEHAVFTSVVQGLNLVSAYLQGKPMPDEEAELEGWGDMVGGPDEPGGGGGGEGGSPDVAGVQMPGMGDDDGES